MMTQHTAHLVGGPLDGASKILHRRVLAIVSDNHQADPSHSTFLRHVYVPGELDPDTYTHSRILQLPVKEAHHR